MLNRDMIESRLALTAGYLQELETIASLSLAEFKADPRNPAAAESFLWRSLESVFDIGRHILAKTGSVDLASEYKSIARALGDRGIIDRQLSESLVQMAGYRNRLVYLYHQITDDELYAIISEDVDDISRFVRNIDHFLDSVV